MKKQNVLGRLFGYMGKFKITMALSMIMAAFSAVVNLSAFVCVYHVAKEIVQSWGDFSALNQAYLTELGWQAVFRISMAFGTYGMALLFSHITAFNTVARIRISLIEHIGQLPLGYHSINPSGKLRKIIEKNTDNLETLISHHIPDFVQSAVLPIAFLAFMFLYDWRLSVVCLIPILIGFILLASMLKGESEGFVQQVQTAGEDIGNAATEYVRGISVVKTFGQTASSFQRYKAAVKEYADFMTKYSFSMENAFSAYNTIINGIFFFLIPGGIILFNLGKDLERTILTFIFFAVLIPLVVTILTKIMHSSSNLMIAEASLVAIDKILSEKPLPTAVRPGTPNGYSIVLDHVSFAYEAGADKALDDVSLEIKPGTITALVGESGGGKSTIANLIARFWDTQAGTVRIGNVDVRDMDYEEWMKQVSIVFQDTNLFKMSILDNVAFYKPGATREEVLRALHLAQCDDILEKLPNGADTVIGTKGVYLSGGEMQRITLARAILKDAPVVLLDEATAFADAENEHLIQKALDELLRGKTVLMIAHRLSTVIHANQICVLEHGKIVERGTHQELLKASGIYAHMFEEYQNSISWKIGGAAVC
ncbi:ABC transporter ATP-binding protein [Flintibacter muris]|uniref:ABC transporter ATP-binding protein n=1 Tax=Flintibacter muris TaxID=2941327 RepID=UPI0020410052|nr:ABC transporter ATP-binding protein [Flintibacter muris]